MISLTKHLRVPIGTTTLLWDMDGVIINSIALDYEVCSSLLSKYVGRRIEIPPHVIRDNFALDHLNFWKALIGSVNAVVSNTAFEDLLKEYEIIRVEYRYVILPGVIELLQAAKKSDLALAVVSSNVTGLIRSILGNAGVLDYFDLVIGYDALNVSSPGTPMQKKPAPDTYLAAMEALKISAEQAVVIEDSVIGVTAGMLSGCFAVGVATGADSIDELANIIALKAPRGGYAIESLS